MSDERVERVKRAIEEAHLLTFEGDTIGIRRELSEARAAIAALDEEPLEDTPVEHQLSLGNMVMEWIVGDYTEGSNSLAGSAIEGMLDYCRAMGITRLVVNQDAPDYDWYRMTQKEQKALLARVAETRAAVANARDGAG